MLIDCPACARSYNVSRAEIGAEGRTVICPRCEAQWFIDGEGTGAILPPSEDLRTTSVSRRPATASWTASEAAAGSSWRGVARVMAAAACLVVAMGVLGARERIVRLMPRTAGLYATIGLPVNVRGLEIVALELKRPEDMPSDVTIAGEIRNVAQRRVGVPRLTYEIRDGAGAPLVTWTERASVHTLGTGKTLPFVSAPHRLPAGAHSVLVRFEDADAAPVRLARRSGS